MKPPSPKIICAFALLCLIGYVIHQKENIKARFLVSNFPKHHYHILKKPGNLHREIAVKESYSTVSVKEAPNLKTDSRITPALVTKILTANKTRKSGSFTTSRNVISTTSALHSTPRSLPKVRQRQNDYNAIIKKIYWDIPDWIVKYAWTTLSFNKCEVNLCRLETDIGKADVVILNMVGLKKEPAFRPEGQIWILFGMESPFNSRSKALLEPSWKSQVNWTMTYRLDSSFPFPYGNVTHRPMNERPNLQEVMRRKKKLVAWVVSNCHFVYSGRNEYVQLLNKHLREPVDIYGKCGTLEAEKDIFKKIDREYKFYLGFENSLCKDYITEKFHLSQSMNLVVIVRGMGNYSYFYPKTSYIDTRDFNSTKQLADYMHYLDGNDTAYLEYLSSKASYKLNLDDMNQNICELCKRQHQPNIIPSYYPDIGEWWYKNACSRAKDLV